MSASTGYSKLQQLETGSHSDKSVSSERPWWRLLRVCTKVVVVSLAVYGLLSALQSTVATLLPGLLGTYRPYIKWGWVHQPGRRSCRCGATLDEAIANGCHYDSHALAWLPPHCQDLELLEEWERSGSGDDGKWDYWLDRNATIPLTVEEVGMLAAKPLNDRWFWMTQEWHVKHCAFAWRKLARSPATGVTVERSTSGLVHIAHCEKMFLMRQDLDRIITRAGVELDADYEETRHMTEPDYWVVPS